MSETDISDDVGDAISAQADEATEPSFGEGEQSFEVKVPEKHSDTIEPNIYNIKPALQDKFKVLFVKSTIQEVLLEELGGKVYSGDMAKQWTTNIANVINRRVKDMKWKRYKHIVQVIIGEQRGAGVKSGIKCVWDSETDNYASEVFQNDSLFCVVVVFAIYFY